MILIWQLKRGQSFLTKNYFDISSIFLQKKKRIVSDSGIFFSFGGKYQIVLKYKYDLEFFWMRIRNNSEFDAF